MQWRKNEGQLPLKKNTGQGAKNYTFLPIHPPTGPVLEMFFIKYWKDELRNRERKMTIVYEGNGISKSLYIYVFFLHAPWSEEMNLKHSNKIVALIKEALCTRIRDLQTFNAIDMITKFIHWILRTSFIVISLSFFSDFHLLCHLTLNPLCVSVAALTHPFLFW